jgi:hypothetical protein
LDQVAGQITCPIRLQLTAKIDFFDPHDMHRDEQLRKSILITPTIEFQATPFSVLYREFQESNKLKEEINSIKTPERTAYEGISCFPLDAKRI